MPMVDVAPTAGTVKDPDAVPLATGAAAPPFSETEIE